MTFGSSEVNLVSFLILLSTSKMKLILLLACLVCAFIEINALMIYRGDEQNKPICPSKDLGTSCDHHYLTNKGRAMNITVDPCEDFYEFLCGHLDKKKRDPSEAIRRYNSNTLTRREMFANANRGYMIELLETKVKPNDPLPLRKAKKFYQACRNKTLTDAGLQPIEMFLNTTGGWPLIMEPGKWNQQQDSWQNLTFKQFNPTSFNIHVKHLYYEGIKLSTKIFLGRLDNETEELNVNSYAKLIKDIALEFLNKSRVHVTKEQIVKDIADMIEFEKKLTKMSALTPCSMVELTFDELQQHYDHVIEHKNETSKLNWKTLIMNSNFKSKGTDKIVMCSLKTLEEFAQILDETESRTIVNYINWYVIKNFISQASPRIRALIYDFENPKETSHISSTRRAREEKCIENEFMRRAIDILNVKNFLKSGTAEEGDELLASIRHEWIKKWQNSTLMKNNKSQYDGMMKMRTRIAYPKDYDNETLLEVYFEELENYMNNYLGFMIKRWDRRDLDLILPSNIVFWDQSSYAPKIEMYKFEYPYYARFEPRSMNYAGLGFEISRVILQKYSFEKSDETYSSISQYLKNKFISYYKEDYEKYVEERKNVRDGPQEPQMLNCLVKDYVAMDITFKAFKTQEKENPTMNMLPHLAGFGEVNKEQQFFMYFAANICEAQIPNYKPKLEGVGCEFASAKFKVNTYLQNSEDFKKAFKCSGADKRDVSPVEI